ncbi:MAG TPA: hypothetical protein VIX12_06575, partial [Candidatus Binataceae bacterium]
LLENDDLMHPNTGESNFNESAYYNFFDRNARLGGFVRLGNRPNEGYAEMTVSLYFPDETVGFMFKRAEIANNDAHDAGGLKFEVIKPFEHHRITYNSKVCILKNPLEMADPAKAFKSNPYSPARLEIDYYGISPGWGGELREKTTSGWAALKPTGDPNQGFAKGHFEQHGHAVGKLVIGEGGSQREYKIDGLGLRDHSWGPRYWQAPKYYRWLTMNFGEDLGAVAALTVNRDGSEHPGGFIARRGRPNLNIRKVDIETEFVGEQQLHDKIKVTCYSEESDEPIIITGKVQSMIPLRNRREGVVTRIAEGMTEWRWNDRVGYGLAEYLDHLTE